MPDLDSSALLACPVWTYNQFLPIAGLPAMLLLKFCAKFCYFRKPDSPDFGWRQAFVLVPLLFGISVLQTSVANTFPTH